MSQDITDSPMLYEKSRSTQGIFCWRSCVLYRLIQTLLTKEEDMWRWSAVPTAVYILCHGVCVQTCFCWQHQGQQPTPRLHHQVCIEGECRVALAAHRARHSVNGWSSPEELERFLNFVMADSEVKEECEKIRRLVLSIGQYIYRATTKGQWKLQKHILVSTTVRHLYRGKQLTTILYQLGHCESYDFCLELENALVSIK